MLLSNYENDLILTTCNLVGLILIVCAGHVYSEYFRV
jgi:hypothetical protein